MTTSSTSPFAFRPSPFAFRPSPLLSELRNRLERVVIEARDVAEEGARAALEALAVHHHEPYPHMKPDQRRLRNQLRARARQLGDRQDTSGRLAIDHLVIECAYEHWHRMLFARFLAENNLLIEPEDNMAISLAEAEELAKEQVQDVWTYASHCAQDMLPQIFRPDDPLLQVTFATEHRIKLEQLLASLPPAVFTASDALGWVYQFWQSKKKEQVNRSEVKIGADELPAVTQLFTEPYMVEFLLHNTLGAWWAGKQLKDEGEGLKAKWEHCQTEADCRRLLSLPGVTWDYLRFVKVEQLEKAAGQNKDAPADKSAPTSGRLPPSNFRLSSLPPSAFLPAAGTFDGWPKAARDIKVLDPCCGSGHFLVAALHHLVPIRMAEEGLSAAEAIDAVLRDNLHGLEIDERCCQIAAFALAFAAWTFPGSGGYRPLPDLHIACTGIGPQAKKEDWLKLADNEPLREREPIRWGLGLLYDAFRDAPTLGSLIDPRATAGQLGAADYETLLPVLKKAMAAEGADEDQHEQAVAAAGILKAADLLVGEYSLVITNVPYLARGKQTPALQEYCERNFPTAKTDLGTVFLSRILGFLARAGTTSLVVTQNWRFQPTYKALRHRLLTETSLDLVGALGPRAFETIGGEVVNVGLFLLTASGAPTGAEIAFVDAAGEPSAVAKARYLALHEVGRVTQRSQLENPDYVLSLHAMGGVALLGDRAFSYQGVKTGDDARYKFAFWELPDPTVGWRLLQGTVEECCEYGGLECVLRWEDEGAAIARLQGLSAWGKPGVAVSQMSSLPCAIYVGAAFDSNMTALIPKKQSDLVALYTYTRSEEFRRELRKIDRSLKPTNSSFARVPFDVDKWAGTGDASPFDPHPWSDDPRQYVFHGRPDEAQEGMELQVAVARLLGYRWPAELDEKMRLSKRARGLVAKCGELAKLVDNDGIVCIPSVRGEEPAAERLGAMLDACGLDRPADLDDWLRNAFFAEHYKLFHDRPFIWHIWDGRKRDGFHALVNYHKLCEGGGKGRRLLESLTYAYLGEWITRQRDGVKRGEGGAEDRLAAALELQKRLEAILAGEPPFDIFVRWKPLAEQPIGWEPDINDGVRLNIRPFLASDLPNGRKGAGILRYRPNIKWTKDRGKEPQRDKADYPWFWGWDEKTVDFLGGKEFDGNRWNDCHYTNKVKQAARDAAGKGKR